VATTRKSRQYQANHTAGTRDQGMGAAETFMDTAVPTSPAPHPSRWKLFHKKVEIYCPIPTSTRQINDENV